jgi:hypothetical protein
MWTIETVYDPDNLDTVLCYLVVDEHDIPIGQYDTIDDAQDAIRTLQGDSAEVRRPAHHTAYYPN